MSQQNIFSKQPETVRVAFYGALFAVAASDGSIAPEELSLILQTAEMQKLSDSAKLTVQSYIVSPPSLDDCLRQLVPTPEILRLSLMFFLVNVAWADKTLKPGEEKALDLAEDRLWILKFKREAIENFVQTVRTIHEQGLSDKEASNLLKEAVAKLESADIPFSTIDPKKISTNFASVHTSYSEGSFWQKVKDFALVAGREVLEKALILYYAAQNPLIPIWAKSTIYAALAYFISPLDGIPDVLPVVGFTDDFATLAAAMAIVAMYITPEVKEQAKQKLEDWFGSKTPVG